MYVFWGGNLSEVKFSKSSWKEKRFQSSCENLSLWLMFDLKKNYISQQLLPQPLSREKSQTSCLFTDLSCTLSFTYINSQYFDPCVLSMQIPHIPELALLLSFISGKPDLTFILLHKTSKGKTLHCGSEEPYYLQYIFCFYTFKDPNFWEMRKSIKGNFTFLPFSQKTMWGLATFYLILELSQVSVLFKVSHCSAALSESLAASYINSVESALHRLAFSEQGWH